MEIPSIQNLHMEEYLYALFVRDKCVSLITNLKSREETAIVSPFHFRTLKPVVGVVLFSFYQAWNCPNGPPIGLVVAVPLKGTHSPQWVAVSV